MKMQKASVKNNKRTDKNSENLDLWPNFQRFLYNNCIDFFVMAIRDPGQKRPSELRINLHEFRKND